MPQNKANTAGGAFLGSILEELARQDADRQKQMMFDLQVDREKRLTRGQDLNNQLAQERLDSEKEMRATNAASTKQKMAADKQATGIKLGETMRHKQPLSQESYDQLPDNLRDQQLPSVQGQGSVETGLKQSSSPGFRHYVATPEQQAMERLVSQPGLDPRARDLVEAKLVTGEAARKTLMGDEADEVNSQRTEGINPATGKAEIILLHPRTGKATWTGIAPPPNSSETRPYTLVVPTANGTLLVNGRDPSQVLGQFDSKPGETAQTDITQAKMTLGLIDNLKQEFDPARVGPIMGRFNSMKELFIGVESDPGLAAFKADVAKLKNTVVRLQTGAAGSEPEYKRIFEETINMNLPPSTFLERLGRAETNYNKYIQDRSKLAFGRTTPSDVDRMTGTQRGVNPARPNDVAPPETTEQKTVRIREAIKKAQGR